MRKITILAAAFLALVSCKKMMEPIRVQMPGTYWSYSQESQIARMGFSDGTHVSVLQRDTSSNTCQAEHGTYTTDGHVVLLTGYNWPQDIKLVRTFSHIKNNSTNRNLTPLSPVAHKSLAGSVWTTMVNDNLNIVFFDHDGTCVDASFINTIHKEGKPYGWQWGRKEYSLNGSKLTVGTGITATLYSDFMQVDTLSVLRSAPAVDGSASSALAGTVWTYKTSGYPGLIIFTSGSTFTRILTSSRLVYTFMNGTYQLSGTSLTMTDGGEIEETCQLSADRFTFLERNYEKVTLP